VALAAPSARPAEAPHPAVQALHLAQAALMQAALMQAAATEVMLTEAARSAAGRLAVPVLAAAARRLLAG
jgi:hypothetical protein